MFSDKRDWATPISGLCNSCLRGDHECSEDVIGFACDCPDCAEVRAASEVEFYNGLEDFFKSIDPDRYGWETIEAEALAGDAGGQVL